MPAVRWQRFLAWGWQCLRLTLSQGHQCWQS
jgi:hypothetical protein